MATPARGPMAEDALASSEGDLKVGHISEGADMAKRVKRKEEIETESPYSRKNRETR